MHWQDLEWNQHQRQRQIGNACRYGLAF
jgi:hypothetical protein